ncbi:MAG TPA: chorismate lyase [Deltaproteobacteria bacterium]|nr:chorismate lyase [Deltaproteobacteria bacterium]
MMLSYTLVEPWREFADGHPPCEPAGLGPNQRLLLLSDGSLTLHLETLFSAPVRVELKHNGPCTLDAALARYLDVTPGAESLEREVWLTVEGRRLVYAHSVIPLRCTEPELLEALRQGAEPIGRVLSARNTPVAKDRIEVGRVMCPKAARELGLDGTAVFEAKRYRLVNGRPEGGWIIKAALTEIFSPALMAQLDDLAAERAGADGALSR